MTKKCRHKYISFFEKRYIYIRNDSFQQMVEHTICNCYTQTATKTHSKTKNKSNEDHNSIR